MHVVHLIDSTGPGGAETVFLDLVRGATGVTGMTNTVLVPSSQNAPNWPEEARTWLPDRLQGAGVPTTRVPTGGSFDFGYVLRLRRILRESGADLIHCHQIIASVYGTAAASLAGIPSICTFHGENDLIRNDRWRSVKHGILKRAKLVLVSRSLLDLTEATTGFDARNMTVIHNGIDTEVFRPATDSTLREQLDFGSEDIIVGAVGNVRRAKGYDVLIDAARRLVAESPRFKFVIVGAPEEPLSTELNRLVEEYRLGRNLFFVGFRDDIPAFLNGCDLFVTSSYNEGFSLTTIQAMACELPVVSTRCGGPAEIVTPGLDGLLVPVGDADTLADAILRVSQDRSLASDLGAKARQKVIARFSVASMVGSYLDTYRATIADSRGG